ncbi:hypothetical protein ZWY2020_007340 [Hordeum vulgare]|nr:hypothetical protein ZWY2020_007340 [Hordeum vulgare]
MRNPEKLTYDEQSPRPVEEGEAPAAGHEYQVLAGDAHLQVRCRRHLLGVSLQRPYLEVRLQFQKHHRDGPEETFITSVLDVRLVRTAQTMTQRPGSVSTMSDTVMLMPMPVFFSAGGSFTPSLVIPHTWSLA